MDARRLAVLVSGTGRHMEQLARLCAAGELDATLGLVLSSRAGVRALERARELGLDARVLDPRRELGVADFSAAAYAAVREAGCGTIVLAGFLRKLAVPEEWRGRILNVHPSLLPAFGGEGWWGERVHRGVLERGCQYSGCTVHYADEEYDHGPILLQRVVEVRPDDTPASLAARVFEAELVALPQALARHLDSVAPRRDAGRAS